MRPLRVIATTTALTTVLTLSLTAFAAPEGGTCLEDTDCDGDLICEVTGASTCAAPACEPGTECPEPTCDSTEIRTCVAPPCQQDADCGAGLRCVRDTYESCTDCAASADGEPLPPECGTCETETYTACVPKPCTTDADCGDPALVCLEETWESCGGTGVSCAPGEDCEVFEPECQTESVSFCGPKYLAPCTVAADCGDGFDCVPEESCGCSGSAGTPTDPAADPMPEPIEPPVEECSCEPTGRNYCEPQQVECPTGDECPTDWECASSPEPAIACAPGMECPEPEPSVPVCLPPMWDALDAWGAAENGSTTSDDRSMLDLLEAPAADPADDAGEGDTTGSGSQDSGGCSIADPGRSTPSAFGLLALLGLALVGRRRR